MFNQLFRDIMDIVFQKIFPISYYLSFNLEIYGFVFLP